MAKVYGIALIVALTLFAQLAAQGAVEPSCGDKELARLQATAAASNLANLYTTRTSQGGAYKKQVAVRHRDGHCEIQNLEAFRVIHEPGHPDADNDGFVKYPDISASAEQKNLYEARVKLKKLKHTSKNSALPTEDNIDFD
jgi:flagellar basal-body rod protein FlgC